MSDLLSELEAVLSALGWSALPVWARVVSVAYAAAIIGHGNLAVVRNVWKAGAATLRGALRVGGGLAAWWRQPSREDIQAENLRRLEAKFDGLYVALGGPGPVTAPNGPTVACVARHVGAMPPGQYP